MLLVKSSKTLLVAGFILGILGWCIAAFTDERQLGISIFIVGFFLVAFGIVSANFQISIPADNKLSGYGLRVGSVGFAVSCISGFLELVWSHSVVATWIFFSGITIGVLGMFMLSGGARKSRS